MYIKGEAHGFSQTMCGKNVGSFYFPFPFFPFLDQARRHLGGKGKLKEDLELFLLLQTWCLMEIRGSKFSYSFFPKDIVYVLHGSLGTKNTTF